MNREFAATFIFLADTINLIVDAAVVDQIQPLLADLGVTATIKEI